MGPKNSTPKVSNHRRVSLALSTKRRRSNGLSRSAKGPANFIMSAKCSSGLSSIPCDICCSVWVAVNEPMDQAVVPPSSGFFSIKMTCASLSAASMAAASPAPPPPITRTSQATSASPFNVCFLRSNFCSIDDIKSSPNCIII